MEPTRSIHVLRKRWLVVVALLVAGIALLLVQNSTILYPDMDSYVLLDGRTLAVRIAHAPCSWTRVSGVTESPDDVRVKVETWPCPIPGPGTASMAMTELTVSLAGDLGTRVVRDIEGQAIPSR
jgi:hypothetical protein